MTKNTHRNVGFVLAVLALLVAFYVPSISLAQESTLELSLYDMSGRMVGTAMLTDTSDGLLVETTIAGMEPVAGDRATMFHEMGICGIGDSFGANYGGVAQQLPNLQMYSNGAGEYAVTAPSWTIADLMDGDGSAYVIHADAGAEIGPPIICGVVPAGEGVVEPAPADPDPVVDPDPTTEPAPIEDDNGGNPGPMPAPAEYEAELRDMSGRVVGTVMLMDDGVDLAIHTTIAGMEPSAGDRATMFHKKGICGVGDSFGSDYGGVAQLLPNLQFYADGSGEYQVTARNWNIDDLMDRDGSAYVIHASAGSDIGPPIACAVIPAGSGGPDPEPTVDPEPTPDPEGEVDPNDLTDEEYLTMLVEGGVVADIVDRNNLLVGQMSGFFELDELSVSLIMITDNPMEGDHRVAVTSQGTCNAPSFDASGEELYDFSYDMYMYDDGYADFLDYIEGVDNADEFLDADGSAVVIYEGPSDAPGDIIACGSMESFPDYLNSLGITVEEYVEYIIAILF